MALEKGYILHDRYEIMEVLGQGGMGAVYQARDISLGVLVAVKENLVGDDEDYTRQFKREASILANMRHPNLPRVTDHFTIEGQGQYLVMDFVEGEDLRERLQRVGKMPEKEVVLIGIAICDALNYLHTQDPPVLHRDIKPGNIKITPSGHVHVVDFGLAKVGEVSQQTTTGARGLTPGYSPPEQYGSARTDQRTDIYALGATLYAMLSGKPPEDGLSIAINQTTLTKITDHNPNTSKQLAIVIERALETKPENRFQSAQEFKDALLNASDTISRQVALGAVTIAPPPPGSFKQSTLSDTLSRINPSTTPGPGGLNLPWYAWAGGGIVLMAVIFGIVMMSNRGDSGGADEAPTPTVAATATDGGAVVEEPTPTEEIVEETVPQIAFASDRSGSNQIWLMDIGGSDEDAVQITDMPGGACQPNWSPDGTTLAFISPCDRNREEYSDSTIFTIKADGSELTPLPTRAGDRDPAYSPDGTQIAFTGTRSGLTQIYILDLATGEVTNFSNTSTRTEQPTWSPDGAYIIYVLAGNQLWYREVATGVSGRVSTSDDRDNGQPRFSPAGDRILFLQQSVRTASPPYFQLIFWDAAPSPSGNGLPETKFAPTEALAFRDPAFSADGQWVAFSSNPDGVNHDIYMLSVAGSDLTQITTSGALDFDPAFRP
ncbi:MAG: serine/threonine-protein kinase [Anaerolineae bacterium]|nr:MAG: serine/threonine-protein kinase [Anaerolineae bacterium]